MSQKLIQNLPFEIIYDYRSNEALNGSYNPYKFIAMKFTETLASHLTPEWRSQYINYAMLKRMLDEAVQAEITEKVFLDDFEIQFFEKCEKELTKINNFFGAKLAETMRKHDELLNEINMFIDRKPEQSSTNLPKYKLNVLKMGLSEHYLNLTLLNNYQSLNFTGFRKILKKHDKLLDNNKGKLWFDKNIVDAPFNTDNVLRDLMEETEKVFTYSLENGDRQRAMKRLRVPPLADLQNPLAIFRCGIFLGATFILSFICCFLAPPIDTVLNRNMFIQLYTPVLLLTLFMLFLSVNVYGWRKAGVNHILIFEINPRQYLTAIDLFEIGCMLAVLLLLSVLGFLYHKQLNLPRFIFPLSLDLALLIYIFNPLPILKRSSRLWMVQIMGRLVAAPFYDVKFADFWLGDQLCSLTQVFVDFAYTICFYLTIQNWHSVEKPSICSIKSVTFTAFAAFLPSWFRFAQCLRRYYTQPHVLHLINAAKYLLGIVGVIFSAIMTANESSYEDPLQSPYTWCWFITSFISSSYSLVYDVKLDWGFFEKKNLFLRSHLIYVPKIYYYLAFVENVILRFRWIIFFTLGVLKLENYTFTILNSVLEIFRRFVWNFFRLENEHLNNVGEYRAVRDISVRPFRRRNSSLS